MPGDLRRLPLGVVQRRRRIDACLAASGRCSTIQAPCVDLSAKRGATPDEYRRPVRVLVTTPAGLGHVHPMVPLVRALLTRGHELRWALPADGVDVVARHGVETIPVLGRGPITAQAVIGQFPEIAARSLRDRPAVIFGKLFGAMATPPMLEALEPAARAWRPHLVLADAAEFAGHIVAAQLGIPSATKGFGPLLPEGRVALAAEEVAPLWTARGLEPRPFGGAYDHLYIDVYPPELQVEGGGHLGRRQLMRPVSDDGVPADDASLPLPTRRPEAPLVYVTLGTIFNDAEPLRRAVEGVRGLHARVLATVGPGGDPAVLGEQPDHVVVERYVPQTALLPHCDAVVSHGGSGTTLGALALGLPQVCLPQGADQFLNADAVQASGAGLSIDPEAASPEAIRDAVAAVLQEPTYQRAAQRVAASIASMPSPSDVAAALEELV